MPVFDVDCGCEAVKALLLHAAVEHSTPRARRDFDGTVWIREAEDPEHQSLLLALKPKERAEWLAGRLAQCQDVMPGEVAAILGLRADTTFAAASRRLSSLVC